MSQQRYINKELEYLKEVQWVYHKNANQNQTEFEKQISQGIQSLGTFSRNSRNIHSPIGADQMYIEMQLSGQYTAYSYPRVLDEGTNLNNRIVQDPPYISDYFKTMRQVSQTHFDFSAFDLATAKKRVVASMYPLYLDDENIGTMTWESDLEGIFEEIIVPLSLKF